MGRASIRSDSGQAITETVLMTWGLVMLLAIMIQAFLIDQHIYRLATAAHARLFNGVAYPGNKPSVGYSADLGAQFEGADEHVPVVGYFGTYGLTREDLRIRSTAGRPGGRKQIRIGRGTRADIVSGLQGVADPGPWLSQIDSGMSQIEQAKRQAENWQARAASRAGRR